MGREWKRLDYKSSCGHILSFILDIQVYIYFGKARLCGRGIFNLLRKCHTLFHSCHFTFPPAVYENASCSTTPIVCICHSVFIHFTVESN